VFWPRIHAITDKGSYGNKFLVKPNKVDAFLRDHAGSKVWYSHEINLLDDGIVGPFDFHRVKRPDELYNIDHLEWATLAQRPLSYSVDTSDIFVHPTRSQPR
jgi:hypothetical protein